MVTVGCRRDALKTFGVISKHERKNVGDCIRKIVDIDKKKQGTQNTSLVYSRQNREKAGRTSIDGDTCVFCYTEFL